MKRFAADPTDKAAIATLSADINYYPALHTTCVATMLSGGHATNALPQRAEATVNCRIFPGTTSESVRQELSRAIGDPSVKVTRNDDGSIDSPASPMRPDVVAAVTKAVRATYPGVPIVPSMAYGASDSMYFRAAGVPSYGVSGMFSENGETFAHGLNEKAPLGSVDGTLVHYDILLKALAK
jgi:carboxypeptidase PM20D1